VGAVGGLGGWILNKRNISRKRELLFSKLMSDVDEIYTRFKMNSSKCEAELLNLRERIFDDFSKDIIDEDKCQILLGRIDGYLEEIRRDINRGTG
jgi:hypothetical protein